MYTRQVKRGVPVFDEHLEVFICILKEGTMINCCDYEDDMTGKNILSGHCTTESGNLVQSIVGL